MNRRQFLLASLASSLPSASVAALGVVSRPQAEMLPANIRGKLMRDPLRPQFHLLPRANWMNDPCAPRYYRGLYHMFFQYNPGAAVWGDMHWAHATSPDLIHWRHLPIALTPTPGSSDAFGCFTGSVLPGTDVPSILYTGVTRTTPETIRGEGLREVQCLATSADPDLLAWKKLDRPVIAAPPPGLKVTGFRDPCPWQDGDTWYLIVGSGLAKTGGAVLLYRSVDARHWEYVHPLAQGQWNHGSQVNPVDTGEMWECPDFFPLDDKHVLLYSTERRVYWEVGVFDKRDLKFHAETRGELDHGSYYAMKSMVDAKGRRILWGWVQETRSPDECRAAGWAGSMALPRVLTLGPDQRLRMDVPPEFASLRSKSQTLQLPASAQAIGAALAAMPIRDRAAEVLCTFKPAAEPCGLELKSTPEASPLLAIEYRGGAGKPSVSIAGKPLPLSPNAEGISTIHLWLDGSVIETFLDSAQAMTARDYTPATGDLYLAWTGDAAALHSLTVSAVKPISPDRLTA